MTDRMEARWQACRHELADAAARAGVEPGLLAKIAGFESGYDPHARPIAPQRHAALNTVTQFDGTRAMSSAYGYGQFTNATWASLIREHGEIYGVADARRLTDTQANTPTLRADTRLQAAMLAQFTQKNVEIGARLGGPNADANVYALHNLGSGAGAAFLHALREEPTRRVDTVLPHAIIERNPALYGDGSGSVAGAYRAMGEQLDRSASYAADIRRLAPGLTPSTPHPSEPVVPPSRPTHSRQTLLTAGTTGNEVRTLQQRLGELGYAGPGGTLRVDGVFGQGTQAAVAAFQRDHHLISDGMVGLLTWHQLDVQHGLRATPAHAGSPVAPKPAPPAQLNHPSHPDYGLFQQALDGIRELDAKHGRNSDVLSAQLGGALAAAAKAAGLHRIDRVLLSADGSRVFASQQDMVGIFQRHAAVDTVQAVHTPLEQSTQRIAQIQASPAPPALSPAREATHAPVPQL